MFIVAPFIVRLDHSNKEVLQVMGIVNTEARTERMEGRWLWRSSCRLEQLRSQLALRVPPESE